MALTESDIANLALLHLGDKGSITTLATDTTPEARKLRALYEVRRDSLLRSYPWNFATKRARLAITYTSFSSSALTDSGSDDLIKVTATAHGLVTGNRVTIVNVEGTVNANGTWPITKIDNNNFTLDGSSWSGAYTSGTGKWVQAPAFGRSYQHTLPTDCLRVLSANEMPAGAGRAKFNTEAGKLLIDSDAVELAYVAKITDPALWGALFVQVFALDLAAAAALGLTQSSQRRQELQAEMFTLLREAKGTDAMESSAWVIMPDEDPDTFNVRNFGVWPTGN
jgi:hypothetical protein